MSKQNKASNHRLNQCIHNENVQTPHTDDLRGNGFGNSRTTFWLLINQNKRTHLSESHIPSCLSQTPTARCGDEVSKWWIWRQSRGEVAQASYPPRGHGKWQGDKLKRPPHLQTSFKSKQFNSSFKYKTENADNFPLYYLCKTGQVKTEYHFTSGLSLTYIKTWSLKKN